MCLHWTETAIRSHWYLLPTRVVRKHQRSDDSDEGATIHDIDGHCDGRDISWVRNMKEFGTLQTYIGQVDAGQNLRAILRSQIWPGDSLVGSIVCAPRCMSSVFGEGHKREDRNGSGGSAGINRMRIGRIQGGDIILVVVICGVSMAGPLSVVRRRDQTDSLQTVLEQPDSMNGKGAGFRGIMSPAAARRCSHIVFLLNMTQTEWSRPGHTHVPGSGKIATSTASPSVRGVMQTPHAGMSGGISSRHIDRLDPCL